MHLDKDSRYCRKEQEMAKKKTEELSEMNVAEVEETKKTTRKRTTKAKAAEEVAATTEEGSQGGKEVNPEEEAKLRNSEYQKALSCVIATALSQHIALDASAND